MNTKSTICIQNMIPVYSNIYQKKVTDEIIVFHCCDNILIGLVVPLTWNMRQITNCFGKHSRINITSYHLRMYTHLNIRISHGSRMSSMTQCPIYHDTIRRTEEWYDLFNQHRNMHNKPKKMKHTNYLSRTTRRTWYHSYHRLWKQKSITQRALSHKK